eukprot:SAG31_NODE_4144_length_3504_cov_7.703276_3_plen_60_part_00
MNREKLARMQKKAESVRTGGKGSVRRKKKAVHKTTTTGTGRNRFVQGCGSYLTDDVGCR